MKQCAFFHILLLFPFFFLLFSFFLSFFHICVRVKSPLPPGDNPIAVNKYYYYYYLKNILWHQTGHMSV